MGQIIIKWRIIGLKNINNFIKETQIMTWSENLNLSLSDSKTEFLIFAFQEQRPLRIMLLSMV